MAGTWIANWSRLHVRDRQARLGQRADGLAWVFGNPNMLASLASPGGHRYNTHGHTVLIFRPHLRTIPPSTTLLQSGVNGEARRGARGYEETATVHGPLLSSMSRRAR